MELNKYGKQTRVAVAMPGKIGDAIYTLPAIREIAKEYGPVDFYTSSYCAPIVPLFEYQSCVEAVYTPGNYTIRRMDMGVQPWYMSIPEGYKRTYQFGYRQIPEVSLPEHFCLQANVPFNGIEYETPEPYYSPSGGFIPYVCIAPRGGSTWDDTFREVATRAQIDIRIIGAKGDYTGYGRDYTGLNLLETASVLKQSFGFIGLGSAMLVLANGNPDIPKIVPHHGYEYDMRHFVYGEKNYYLTNPTADAILERIPTIQQLWDEGMKRLDAAIEEMNRKYSA
jgi:hypothetical protein